jgi:hypothetical protein
MVIHNIVISVIKIFLKLMGGSRESPVRTNFSSHHKLRTVLKWKRGNKKLTDPRE